MSLEKIRPVGRFTNPLTARAVNIKKGKVKGSGNYIYFYIRSGKRIVVPQLEFFNKWKT